MNQIVKSHAAIPPRDLRVVIISANWHREIVHRSRDCATDHLIASEVLRERITHFELPGAFELPLRAKRLAQSGAFDAVIACALVVDGGIYRHDFVANAVVSGLMQVQLETDTPVFSAVLTPHQFHESETHRDFFSRHFEEKGREVAQAVIATVCSPR
jgi:6,7-dimethyl-8-ribityllumazine synthase